METRIEPAAAHQYIMPIASRGIEGWRLEGTAFVLATAQEPRIITAAHVIKGFDPSRPTFLGMAPDRAPPKGPSHRSPMHKLRIVAAHYVEGIDVGWLEIEPPHRPELCVPIAKSGVFFDSDVLCLDYSPARPEQVAADGSQAFFADTWAHRGNIVRAYVQDGIEYLNLSFPTMQGASGSPVLTRIDGIMAVAGMVVGNLEQQFAPSILAQRVTVTDGDKFSESVSCFLPYGVALSAHSLLDAVCEFCEPQAIEPKPQLVL